MLTRLLTYLRTAIAWLQPRRVVTTTTLDGERVRLVAWVFRGRVFLGRVAAIPPAVTAAGKLAAYREAEDRAVEINRELIDATIAVGSDLTGEAKAAFALRMGELEDRYVAFVERVAAGRAAKGEGG